MSGTGLAFSVLAAILAASALAGQVHSGRVRAARMLAAYLAVSVALRPPIWFWPDDFYNWAYWLATDLVQTALALGAALELNWRAFGHLPPGRRRAARLAAAVTIATFVGVVTARQSTAQSAAEFYFQASNTVAHATAAAAIVSAVFLALSWWYELPTDPFHQEIAGGIILWALLMACGNNLAVLDPYLNVGRSGFQRIGHVLVLGAWAVAAWRRAPATALDPAVLAFLQPWRRAA